MRKHWKILTPILLLVCLLGVFTACELLGPTVTPAETTTPVTDPATPEETQPNTDAFTDDVTEEPTEKATEKATETPTKAPKPVETEPVVQDKDVVKASPDSLSFTPTVTVKQNGGSATVTHSSGLSYTATGYTAANNNKLTFTKNLTLSFDAAKTAKAFNRFTLGYTSTQPLYGKVTYTVGGQTVTDDFYLEAGTRTFSCLIRQYLNSKKGAGIVSMTFSTCNGASADFALCVLKTEDYPVYGVGADTYYIENHRYKLGVRLIWGGGINYIQDKNTPVTRLKNLINQADTGRLVQQSYYGVKEGNPAYTPGFYNGSVWPYNPVQGGDVAQNHSRIIDIVVKDYSVYVKSQPMDWSKDNEITPSYMENTYTLYSDRIQVDNRFVDFSGWTHRMTSQELPAFYTVSYLNKFTFYNGTKPWTNDTLSYRDDLNFWGDSNYHNDCVFRLRASNTETWCAWTNAIKDYGIGLYVPNVDSYLAGRHAFNNSTSPTDGATNYVAPVNMIQIKSFEALEYSYLITTGSVEEIRNTFKTHRNFATNASLNKNSNDYRISDNATVTNEKYYTPTQSGNQSGNQGGTTPQPSTGNAPANLNLTVQGNAGLITAPNGASVQYASSANGVKLTVTGDDPQTLITYGGALSANTYKTLTITYMIPTSNSKNRYTCDLFLAAGNLTDFNANARIRSEGLVADGQFHTLTINLGSNSYWTGNVHKLRFDFFEGCAVGDVMYIKSFVLS